MVKKLEDFSQVKEGGFDFESMVCDGLECRLITGVFEVNDWTRAS